MDSVLAPQVAKLLEMGEPRYAREFAWPDYQALGLRPEHIPALIHIATDPALINLEDGSDPRSWGPVHAWRALGQMKAEEAIIPLIQLFHEIHDNDWVIEEMPDVFALIGSAAYLELASYLRDGQRPVYSRMVAATSLMEIARSNPDMQFQVIEILVEQLIPYNRNTPGTNGVLIANLIELEAVEQRDLIHKVFVAGKVDRFITGDWRDVKKRLDPNRTQPSASRDSLARDPGSPPSEPSNRSAVQEPKTAGSGRRA